MSPGMSALPPSRQCAASTTSAPSATSGVINQQGRPFTHGYEIHLEKATLVFDLGAGQPLTVLTHDGKVQQPKLGSPEMTDAFPIELKEAGRAITSGKPSPKSRTKPTA